MHNVSKFGKMQQRAGIFLSIWYIIIVNAVRCEKYEHIDCDEGKCQNEVPEQKQVPKYQIRAPGISESWKSSNVRAKYMFKIA